ncbi:hypothetical protein [Antrihabitans cavernicola]|uniref:hypothetical protein n=1 Tax=Antrihabitans cavernicola TaxID=2495913 RepID=UPI001658DC3C|nr:hypothetical protein [Spelaeibacter cavernicola]
MKTYRIGPITIYKRAPVQTWAERLAKNAPVSAEMDLAKIGGKGKWVLIRDYTAGK